MQDLKKLKNAYQKAYKGYEKAIQSAAAAAVADIEAIYNNIREKLELLKENEGA